jgi:ribosomal protein L37AE/L43A
MKKFSEWMDERDYEDRDEFEDPGGRSALRKSSESNPRIHPCPTCGRKNRLTTKDVRLGYQCDSCADSAEGYGYPRG